MFLWFSYDFPWFSITFLWFSYDFPWFSYDFSMIFHHVPLVFLWFSHGFPSSFYGFPMIFPPHPGCGWHLRGGGGISHGALPQPLDLAMPRLELLFRPWRCQWRAGNPGGIPGNPEKMKGMDGCLLRFLYKNIGTRTNFQECKKYSNSKVFVTIATRNSQEECGYVSICILIIIYNL